MVRQAEHHCCCCGRLLEDPAFDTPDNRNRPFAVNRYFCSRLFGLPGIVYSMD